MPAELDDRSSSAEPGRGEKRAGLSGGARCPIAEGFDPLSPSQISEPYELLGRLRREQPVFYVPQYDFWCVTRYDDVVDVLSDAITYSVRGAHTLPTDIPAEILEEVGAEWQYDIEDRLNLLDPPRHTRLRKILAPPMTPKRLGRFEPQVRAVAEQLLGSASGRKEFDLATEYAAPIPPKVIASILGIGADAPEVDRFHVWAESFHELEAHPTMGGNAAAKCWRDLIEAERFILEFIARRRRELADDLTSELIALRDDGGGPALNDRELLASIISYEQAGSVTTAILIVHTVWLLLRRPDRWRAVDADRTLIPLAVEEALRHSGVVHGIRRTATRDVQIGGVDIPAGSTIYLSLISADRDEAHFPDPDDFNMRRGNQRDHLAFGLRAHFCIGAPLSRLEARVAVEVLLDHYPNLRLVDPEAALGYSVSHIPGITSLPVRLGLSASRE